MEADKEQRRKEHDGPLIPFGNIVNSSLNS